MKCPDCNNIVPDGSKFCNHCGHKFEQENTIKCPNPECGHSIPVDSKFCPDCGQIISGANPPKEEDSKYYLPFPQGKDEYGCRLYGYKDIRTGEVVIKPQYHYAYRFHEGLAAVGMVPSTGRGCSRMGYINHQGNLIIPFIYSHAEPFSEGLAWVDEGIKKWWCIDKKGNRCFNFPNNESDYMDWEVDGFPSRYTKGVSFIRLLYKDRGEDSAFIDRYGKETSYDSSYFGCAKANSSISKIEGYSHFGIVDLQGKSLVPPIYDYIEYIGEGYYSVQKEGLYGVYYEDGKEIAPCIYKSSPIVNHCGSEVTFMEEDNDYDFNYWGRIL